MLLTELLEALFKPRFENLIEHNYLSRDIYVCKRQKLEYLDFAGDPVLIHLTQVRCFGLAHEKLGRISEPRIPRL
jgi:hypothetical protein